MKSALKTRHIALLALAAFVAILPLFVTSQFWLGFWITILFYALLGQAWNILGGYAGQSSFGHAAFFGTGAYAAAVLQVQFGMNAWVAALGGIVLGGAVGAAVGALTFRYGLRGSYFALVTLAFAEVFRILANAWSVTGAGFGMLLPLDQSFSNLQFADRIWFYYLIGVLVVLSVLIVMWIENSRFGAYLVAVRENEEAAQALGIDCFRVKVLAITLSGALTAMAGVFYVQYYLFIDSGIAYGTTMSVNALLGPIIGGTGTVFGPVVGALMLGGLGEITSLVTSDAPGVDLLIYGVLLLLILRFLPNGVMGLLRRLFSRRVVETKERRLA